MRAWLLLALFAPLVLLASEEERMAVLASGLEGPDLAAVLELVESSGVEWEVRGRAIYVPANKADQLRVKVASEGLITGGSIGFELFDESGFGQSDLVQRTNLTRARQGELERMIESIQGVHNARVMIVIPENKLLLGSDKPKPTAAVQVDLQGGQLAQEQLIAIRNLVAHSVPGLQTARVAIMDNQGNDLSYGLPAQSMPAKAITQDQLASAWELVLRDRLHCSLLREGYQAQRILLSVELSINASYRLPEGEDFPNYETGQVDEITVHIQFPWSDNEAYRLTHDDMSQLHELALEAIEMLNGRPGMNIVIQEYVPAES